jgi:Protein of unknown function (DUF3501)
MVKRQITRADLIPMADYASQRRERRRHVIEIKQARRMEVGPFAMFYFECYETMWHQVHEMLFVERGGDDQIDGELAAYNPLIPKGDELVATLMFEIDEPERRAKVLAQLGGVENTATMTFANEIIRGRAETDSDRTRADGKASSVQFVHFSFTREQIAKFREPGIHVVVGFEHSGYRHMAIMPDAVKVAVAKDFD